MDDEPLAGPVVRALGRSDLVVLVVGLGGGGLLVEEVLGVDGVRLGGFRLDGFGLGDFGLGLDGFGLGDFGPGLDGFRLGGFGGGGFGGGGFGGVDGGFSGDGRLVGGVDGLVVVLGVSDIGHVSKRKSTDLAKPRSSKKIRVMTNSRLMNTTVE